MLILIHTKFNNGQFIHTISSDKIYTDSSQLALTFVITNNQIKHALKKYLVKNNINPIQSENDYDILLWVGKLRDQEEINMLKTLSSFTSILSLLQTLMILILVLLLN